MRFLTGLLILGITGIAHSQASKQPFTLTLSAEKSEVRVGDPVYLDILMANISHKPVDCTVYGVDTMDMNHMYRVLDESGQPVPKLPKKYPGAGQSSTVWPCVLKPGGITTPSGGQISRLFDFSRPGKYSIQVSRYVRRKPPSDIIYSNTITITVTE